MPRKTGEPGEFQVLSGEVDVEAISESVATLLPAAQQRLEPGYSRATELMNQVFAATISKADLHSPVVPGEEPGAIARNFAQSITTAMSNLKPLVAELMRPCREGDQKSCLDNFRVSRLIIEGGLLSNMITKIGRMTMVSVSMNSVIPISKLTDAWVYGHYISLVPRGRSAFPSIERPEQQQAQQQGQQQQARR